VPHPFEAFLFGHFTKLHRRFPIPHFSVSFP